MLGKKKKQDEKAAAQADLDKPQTLAELDAMAREKKGNDDKVMLTDDNDNEHEMSHSDELTVDVDVKKVTGSQRRLWVLVIIASIMMLIGGIFFYIQLEDGEGIGIGAGGQSTGPTEEEVESVIPRGTFGYVAKAGESSYTRHNLESNEETSVETSGSIGNQSNSFQLSSNGLVSAVDTGSGIVVKGLDSETTVLGDSNNLRDWLLIPDGTRIFALVGSALHAYDATSGEGGEVAANFEPTGPAKSRLGHSRDGSVFMYAKSDTQINGSIYEIASGEVTEIDRTVVRLGRVSSFDDNSISPDGNSIVFFAEVNDNQTLQLLSLNSFVLRTIYVAEPGNRPTDFRWSIDSNNVAVYESGGTSQLSNLRVGTLEKEVVVENAGAMSQLSWAPDKSYIGFVRGGTFSAVELESKEIVEIISSVGSRAAVGWIQN